jgi:4'-phosphopantetheinyl transferase
MKKVKIVIVDIRQFTCDTEQVLSQIAPRYAEKYKKTKRPKDAHQELVSGFLLKQYLGIIRDEQFTCNEYGKPFLTSGDCFFNLSHSEDYVVLAIVDCNVGIDVEKVRTCHEATVKKVFNTRQKEKLLGLEGDARNERFTQIWTECEALLKLKGTGFGDEWNVDNRLVESCDIHTFQMQDYIITCVTEMESSIEIEKYKF